MAGGGWLRAAHTHQGQRLVAGHRRHANEVQIGRMGREENGKSVVVPGVAICKAVTPSDNQP